MPRGMAIRKGEARISLWIYGRDSPNTCFGPEGAKNAGCIFGTSQVAFLELPNNMLPIPGWGEGSPGPLDLMGSDGLVMTTFDAELSVAIN